LRLPPPRRAPPDERFRAVRPLDRLGALRRLEERPVVDFRPRFGFGFTFTPARRARESPMAMACFRLLARPLPRFSSCISSATNFPAFVLGDFRLDFLAAMSCFLPVNRASARRQAPPPGYG